MNDLRSPVEDHPYRQSPRMAQEEYAQNEYEQYPLFERIRYSRWFPLGSVFAAIILFSAIVSYAYKQGTSVDADVNAPIIEAESASYKEKPADPGGMDVPFQDAVVFDQLQDKNKTAENETVESLLPPPEQALTNTADAPAAPATTPTTKTEAPSSDTEETAIETADTQDIPPANASDNAGNVATAITETEPSETDANIVTTAEVPEPSAPVTTATAPTNNNLAKTLDKTAPASAPASARIESGSYRIQLGAFREESAARAAWAKFKQQHASQLGSVTPQFPRADLGEKGVFYRVQGVNLSKASADDLCRSINAAKGGSCLVVK